MGMGYVTPIGGGGGGGGISGGGTADEIAIFSAATVIGSFPTLRFNSVNGWLKIGSALGTIDAPLHVRSNTMEIGRFEGGTTFPLRMLWKNASVNDIGGFLFSSVGSRGGVCDFYSKRPDNNQATPASFGGRLNQNGLWGFGTNNPQQLVDVNGGVSFRQGPDFSTTGVQSDVDLGTYSFIRYTGAGTAAFTGIINNTDGKLLTILNTSSSDLTIRHEDGASTAANRIITNTGDNIVLTTNALIDLRYDATTQRWRTSNYTSRSGGIQLLASATVDGTSAGSQIVYTVPSGGNVIFCYAVARLVSLNNLVSAAGAVAEMTNIAFATTITPSISLLHGLGSIGTGTWTPFYPLQTLSQLPLAATNQVGINFTVPITVGAGGDATYVVELYGYNV